MAVYFLVVHAYRDPSFAGFSQQGMRYSPPRTAVEEHHLAGFELFKVQGFRNDPSIGRDERFHR